MKNIVVKKLANSEYDYLIFSTNVWSPFRNINKVIRKINNGKPFRVVFDQLLQTGDNSNRFIGFYVNKNIDYNSAKVIAGDDNLRSCISRYLYDNQDLMNNSILLDKQKEIIKREGII